MKTRFPTMCFSRGVAVRIRWPSIRMVAMTYTLQDSEQDKLAPDENHDLISPVY